MSTVSAPNSAAVALALVLQGLDEPFLEQWHQKIHQASSPEDVIIAEAYLAYLHSANHDDYWRVLEDNGITKERIKSWEQPITGECSAAAAAAVAAVSGWRAHAQLPCRIHGSLSAATDKPCGTPLTATYVCASPCLCLLFCSPAAAPAPADSLHPALPLGAQDVPRGR